MAAVADRDHAFKRAKHPIRQNAFAEQHRSKEFGGDPRLILLEKIMRMRANTGADDRGPPPDFAIAPLLSVYAWCLAEANRRERQDPTPAPMTI